MDLADDGSNILGGSSAIRRSHGAKSNIELVASLRANFDHQDDDQVTTNGQAAADQHDGSTLSRNQPWTKYDQTEDWLEIPALDFTYTSLEEEREQYDITMKLFFLPGTEVKDRDSQARAAVNLVLKELHMPSVDLLIVSFPGVYFDEEEECPDKISTRGPIESTPEPLETQIKTWKVLEALYDEGIVKRLGIAEFGHDRLNSFIAATTIKPGVNQINLRDCCSVPKDLMTLAKSQSVELLVHNDCSNILPRGTLRELLGPGPDGANVLAASSSTGEKRKSLHDSRSSNLDIAGRIQGEVYPQWVARYTAVVKNRGVVESKGYFAVAEID